MPLVASILRLTAQALLGVAMLIEFTIIFLQASVPSECVFLARCHLEQSANVANTFWKADTR